VKLCDINRSSLVFWRQSSIISYWPVVVGAVRLGR